MTTPPTNWRKSARSKTSSCVEVGRVGDGAAVRDTKDRSLGYFTTNREQWAAFVDAVKSNRFDG
ncbi:DUF397 domain-containing protein [Parasphingorhabdus pacifica]